MSRNSQKNYKLIDNAPIPEPRHSYPFEEMEVGQSFKITGSGSEETADRARKARNAAYQFSKKRNAFTGYPQWRFSLRKIGPLEFQLWRVPADGSAPADMPARKHGREPSRAKAVDRVPLRKAPKRSAKAFEQKAELIEAAEKRRGKKK